MLSIAVNTEYLELSKYLEKITVNLMLLVCPIAQLSMGRILTCIYTFEVLNNGRFEDMTNVMKNDHAGSIITMANLMAGSPRTRLPQNGYSKIDNTTDNNYINVQYKESIQKNFQRLYISSLFIHSYRHHLLSLYEKLKWTNIHLKKSKSIHKLKSYSWISFLPICWSVVICCTRFWLRSLRFCSCSSPRWAISLSTAATYLIGIYYIFR